MNYEQEASFSDLKGKLCVGAIRNEEELIFVMYDGTRYRMYHEQDCCENVYIESIVGDLSDLEGEVIEMAEEVTNTTDAPLEDADESYTWTFYKLATRKGYIDIRWFGTSNGYYSESVNFMKL